MKFFDLRHPFFNPLWRRVLTTAITSGWTLVELAGGNPGWAILFGAIAVMCIYQFFFAWEPQGPGEKGEE